MAAGDNVQERQNMAAVGRVVVEACWDVSLHILLSITAENQVMEAIITKQTSVHI